MIVAAEHYTIIDACHGVHPPLWINSMWVCARCGIPLDTRKRAVVEPEVVWIDAKWLRPQ